MVMTSPPPPFPSPPVFDPSRLQSQMAHESLLHLHDNEILLLENIKRFSTQKTGCDREYTRKVSELCSQAKKSIAPLEGEPSIVPLLNTWSVVLKETERTADLLKAGAEEVTNKLIEVISAIIGEKKFTKKKYTDSRQRLDSEVSKAVSLVQSYHSDYHKLVIHNRAAREKYEELFRKNKQGKKFADAKAKFRKSSIKLHTLHNNYILGLEDVSKYEEQRKSRLVPGLLDLHHSSQVNLVAQTKDTLAQLHQCMNTSAEAYVTANQRVAAEIHKISPGETYRQFCQRHRKEVEDSATMTFDNDLLRDYQGTLSEGRLAVDDLTLADLQSKEAFYAERLRVLVDQIENKQQSVQDLEVLVERPEVSETPVPLTELVGNGSIQSRILNSNENLLQTNLSQSDNANAGDVVNGNVESFPVTMTPMLVCNGNATPPQTNGLPPKDDHRLSACSASLRPLSGTSLIVQNQLSQVSLLPEDENPSPTGNNNYPTLMATSPLTSDTITPNSPTRSSPTSTLSSPFSSPTSTRGMTSDGSFVIGNSSAIAHQTSVSKTCITDQAPVNRGQGSDSEIHLSAIRCMRQELDVLQCDRERCEAKLSLVKTALESVRGDDGEMEAPAAILGEDATPLSTFKKNHKNRLTKIFKKGADPVPPPPPDYPNDDGRPMLSVVGTQLSLSEATTNSSSDASSSTGGVTRASTSPSLQNIFPDRHSSVASDPQSPGAVPHRHTESYMDVDPNRVSRGRAGSYAPSFTQTISSDVSGVFPPNTDQCAPPLEPVGEDTSTTSPLQTPTIGGSSTHLSRTSSSVGHHSSRHSISLDSTATLEDEEWFHGILPRDEVVRLLSENGDFLVRETTKNGKKNIVLSVAWQGHKHFMVQKTAEGKFRFEGHAFPSVQELIRNQLDSGSPVTVKSGAVLQRPIPRMDWEIRNDDIVLREKIGNGNFGEVYKGSLNTTGQDVAIKTCKINLPEDQKKKFLQEGSILKQYNHPNIVKLIGIAAQRQPIMIVMELVDGGSLLSFLRKHGGKQSQKTLAKMCADAAAGMEYLESVKCIHRDLAARNCLVGNAVENNSKIVKISDFGMSRENEIYECSDGMKQIPIKWTAPEALNWGRYTSLCDVWSFGILMWEIFSHGSTPYPGWPNPRAREEVERGYRMPAPEGTPDKMYQLMRRCWEYEQENRPHFDAIHSEIRSILEAIC